MLDIDIILDGSKPILKLCTENWELNNVSLYQKQLVNVNWWSYVILIIVIWFFWDTL